MSDQDDVIRIDLESDVSEGEAAKRKLEEVARAVNELRSSFQAGNVGLAAYKSELASLTREAGKAQAALDRFNEAQVKSGAQKLTGSDRAGAKARLGLAAANIAQDAIQGGPASTINNILGLAGDGKIRSLIMEFVEGAGGVQGLATKLGVAGAAAAALFVTLDQGLKSAKLEWSDLDEVAGNLAPFKAASELFAGLGEIAKGWHLDAAWEGASEAASGYVNAIADATLGWNSATEAAKAHKEEVERGVKAARDYAAAAKAAAGIRSEDQQEQARRGKEVGQELANLGKGGGLDAVARKLAERATAKGGDDKVKVPELDAKGQPTGEMEDVTRREAKRRDYLTDLVGAAGGDTSALDRLRPELGAAGYDLGGVNAAAGGRGSADDKEAEKLLQERIRDAEKHVDEVSRSYEKSVGDIAKPLQDRFNASTASGNRIDEGAVQGKLRSLGYSEADAAKFAKPVLESLQQGYNEDVRDRASKKGLTFEGGAKDLLAEYRQKEVDAATRKSEGDERDRAERLKKLTAGTGLDEQTRTGLMRLQLGGMDPEKSADRIGQGIAAYLGGRGMAPEEADRAAAEYVAAQNAKLRDDVIGGAIKGDLAEARGPERVAAQDFARQVESSGTRAMEAEQKQTNTLLGRLVEQQAEMLRRPNYGVLAS